jgi:hypothetical protein
MAELIPWIIASIVGAGTGVAASQLMKGSPKLPQLAPPPQRGDAEIQAADLAERQRRARAVGRKSTILTDDLLTPLNQRIPGGDIRRTTLLGG